MNKDHLLAAMKADAIPKGWSNLWLVTKTDIPEQSESMRFGKPVLIPAGTYTFLRCLTEATLYNWPPGEVVMEDTPFELRTHLGFVMQAFGRVLITGLGLGCVVRGLLANPEVEHVTVIENSPDVLKLVAPHMPTERLTIVEEDAFKWVSTNDLNFDCAWHDLWTNKDEGEPHLDFWHVEMLWKCRRKIARQGAWALNRRVKRQLVQHGFEWMG